MQSDAAHPVHVGAELSEVELGIDKDNTGDNISDKNPYYCELTALYHLWKNSNASFKGLMHYRRLLDLNSGNIRWYNKFPSNIVDVLGLNKQKVNVLMQNYDIILPMKRVIQQAPSAYEYYRKRHYISDMDRTLEIIKEKSPQIYDTAVDVLKNSNELYLYNIFISSKEFLDNYAEWLLIFWELWKLKFNRKSLIVILSSKEFTDSCQRDYLLFMLNIAKNKALNILKSRLSIVKQD